MIYELKVVFEIKESKVITYEKLMQFISNT